MTVHAIAVDPQHPERFIAITQEQPQPGPHDLLVEVKAVSINPVDTKVHAGLRKNGLAEPRVLGAYSHRDRSVIRMTIDHDFA